MNFQQLKDELSARGFNYLSDARLGQFINVARHELDTLELWPYRLTTATGSSSVTISDLGVVESVTDSGNNYIPLSPIDRRSLADAYQDLTITGSPMYYYTDAGNVYSYPVGGSLTVRYYRRLPDLLGSTDIPASPSQYHMLIIDMAARWAYKDSDNFQISPVLTEEINRQVAEMRNDLLLTAPGVYRIYPEQDDIC